jgi:hypothetical protein
MGEKMGSSCRALARDGTRCPVRLFATSLIWGYTPGAHPELVHLVQSIDRALRKTAPWRRTSGDDGSRSPTAALLAPGANNSGGGGTAGGAGGAAPAAAAAAAGGGKPQRGALEVDLYGGSNVDDEDLLLDWEHHAMRRWQMFGADCTWMMRYLPERFHSPPQW